MPHNNPLPRLPVRAGRGRGKQRYLPLFGVLVDRKMTKKRILSRSIAEKLKSGGLILSEFTKNKKRIEKISFI